MSVTVSDQMMVSAIRYALGRRTYIVGMTVDEVIRVWPELDAATRSTIKRDVSHHITYNKLSMECDSIDWIRLIRFAETYLREGK